MNDVPRIQAPTPRLPATLSVVPRLLDGARAMRLANGRRRLVQQLDIELDGMRKPGRSSDYREGVAAFGAKRAAAFAGR